MMKEKELFIKALGNLFHSWAGDTPTSVYETGNMLLNWYEQEYNVVLGIRFERDEDWEDNYDEVIETIKKSDKDGTLKLSSISIDLVNELINEGWEFSLNFGDEESWSGLKGHQWCADFTRNINGKWDNHESGYSYVVDDAIRKAYFNIRKGIKYKSRFNNTNDDETIDTGKESDNEIQLKEAQSWWNDLADKGLCDDMLKKYNHYGHDIGVNINDLVDMYLQENKNTEE